MVGPAPIPPEARDFPVFRQPRLTPDDPYSLWDGAREWRVHGLPREQRSYPILAMINDTLLVERALSAWRQEDHEY